MCTDKNKTKKKTKKNTFPFLPFEGTVAVVSSILRASVAFESSCRKTDNARVGVLSPRVMRIPGLPPVGRKWGRGGWGGGL